MKKEEIQKLVATGIHELNTALAEGRSQRLQELLAVMARFPRYSFNNCLLIAQQRPEATMVQGFQSWRKLGRMVIKGEKGIGITAPLAYRKKDAKSDEQEIRGFRVVHVFDVEQTEGEDLLTFAEPEGDAGKWVVEAERVIRSQGIELIYEPLSKGVYGYSAKGKVVIQADLQPAQRMSTLIHELCHELLHPDTATRKENSKAVKETEAEAVAHVVCQAIGIQSLEHSTDYIHLHDGDTEVLAKSMQRIQKCAARILKELTEDESNASCDDGSSVVSTPMTTAVTLT